MYEFIEGKLCHIYPTYLVLLAGGVGYHLTVANPYRFQDYLQEDLRIYVQQVVRQDAIELYGFKDQEEKQLFLTLNKVSGIGPKSAMSILALDDHDGLIQAIEDGDDKYLTKFPGVGKKTSQQMILDLKGNLDFVTTQRDLLGGEATIQSRTGDSQILGEVLEALEGLGYSKREINRVEPHLEKEDFETTQKALSFAFKLLIK